MTTAITPRTSHDLRGGPAGDVGCGAGCVACPSEWIGGAPGPVEGAIADCDGLTGDSGLAPSAAGVTGGAGLEVGVWKVIARLNWVDSPGTFISRTRRESSCAKVYSATSRHGANTPLSR